MYLHSHVQWETLNSKRRQSNKDKEIINRTLIISYFLIFLLVFILLFLLKITFLRYDASEAETYSDYTGSIHVGVDTVAGDYYIKNESATSDQRVYGVRTDESDDFTIMAYSDNQIIQLKNGEHLITYKADLVPVNEQEHEILTTKLDAAITSEIAADAVSEDPSEQDVSSEESTSISDLANSDGMVKLNNHYYNVPFVLVANGENPYIELYDKDINVLNLQVIDSEHIYTISPTEASYVKLNDVKLYTFNDYVSSGRNVNGTFSSGVYIVGRGIESGDFILESESENCEYRIIPGIDEIGSTPMQDCTDLPRIISLDYEDIIEYHGAKLTIYHE